MADFVITTFRTIIANIDKSLYNLISVLYEILLELANRTIFEPDQIDEFADRIYIFLGLIMVFKVTFSLISYLVNPDTISDSTNGAGNIAKNIIITLVLIIIVPWAFDLMYDAQSAILTENILPRFILGTEEGELTGINLAIDPDACQEKTATISDSGKYMALLSFRPFFQISDSLKVKKNGKVTLDSNYIDDESIELYCTSKSVNQLLIPDIYNATDAGDNYIVSYSTFWSTVAGVIVTILLITTCMEVALRAIKLGFLEIVAPIPIISYVDPKSGKDGIFKKWLNEVIKTWASLFIRLSAISRASSPQSGWEMSNEATSTPRFSA